MMASDPLEKILAPPPAEPPAFRDALRERTARLIGRRRWFRRLRWAMAAALLFGAGMATMAWLRQPAPVVTDPAPPVVKGEAPGRQPGAPEAKEPSALALELKSLDLADAKKAQVLAKVASKYLEEHDDYDAALRCYRQALNSADPSFLDLSPDDDWLVMALKLERRKER